MGCLRFCFILVPVIFNLISLVLVAIACAGSSRNNTLLTNTYLIDINLSGLNPSLILSLNGVSSAITSQVSSLTQGQSTNRDLGLSDVYTFGMWGYCKGNLRSGASNQEYSTDGVDFTFCSKPKAMYVFNPADVLLSDISGSETDLNDVVDSLDSAGVTLPSSIEDYMRIVTPLSKLIFICTIIGLALTCLQLLLSFFTVCSRGCSCFVFFLGSISFISLILACGASTGAFMYIRREFNNSVSDFGITADLSRYYLAFYWAGCVASLVSTIFWFLSICCCSTGPFFGSVRRPRYDPPMEHFREKL